MSHFIRLMKSWLKLMFWSKMSTKKVQTIDPLFVAVAELSESVSDLNTRARYLGAKASAAGASVGKAGSAYAVGKIASKLFRKRQEKIRRSFMSKFLNTLVIGAASGAAAAISSLLKKVKPLRLVLMRRLPHSKKISLTKTKWWKKLTTTKIWQLIPSKTTKQNLKMVISPLDDLTKAVQKEQLKLLNLQKIALN